MEKSKKKSKEKMRLMDKGHLAAMGLYSPQFLPEYVEAEHFCPMY